MQIAERKPRIACLPTFVVTPTLLTDGYKIDHRRQYVRETKKVYANMTPRSSRIDGIQHVIVFGIQYYCLSTLMEIWNNEFFNRDFEEIGFEFMNEMEEYTLSKKSAQDIGIEHWRALHQLGYLPLEIKALEEGTKCPIKVPVYTVVNTNDDFYWLTNFIETDMSSETYGFMTSATISREFNKIFTKWCKITGGNPDMVKFQGHNFSYRGMMGREAAAIVDMGHLTSFVGSDTLHGRKYLKRYYKADQKKGIISCSVFATEHAVMCCGTGFYIKRDELTWEKYGEAEFKVFERLITELYPNGIVSIVCDTWDLWQVLVDYMVKLKDVIMKRDGKLVVRPDSGNPVDIICGIEGSYARGYEQTPEEKGVVQLLWEIFGGTVNELGFKELDPHVGTIYGDSITLERADRICHRLYRQNFCSLNWIAGIGSYTYQYVTRDTFGFAQKATWAEVEINGKRYGIDIFKQPKTDKGGLKKSACGLLRVERTPSGLILHDRQTPEQEKQGELKTVFLNGRMVKEIDLEQIRENIKNEL